MNGFRRICAVILGMVLLIAGILKIMDPVGSGLVMEEYLKFFHMRFLLGAAKVLACAMAMLESLLGAALMAGVWRKPIALTSAVVLIFFTILTSVLYIAKPAMDCGCFGEAVHLNHAQTFLKNLILDALWCLAFLPFRNPGAPQRIKYVSFSLAAISLVMFLLYSSLSIPLRDYTDFKPGIELEEQPLYFYDASYDYADSLALKGRVMVISAYDPSGIDETKTAGFMALASEKGFTPLLLLASSPDDPGLVNPLLLSGCWFSDRKLLLTLNRSNGGVTYLNDGQVIRKWASRSLPDGEDLDALMQTAPMDCLLGEQNRTRAVFQGFTLYLFAVLLLL